jgi:hypothetical protein
VRKSCLDVTRSGAASAEVQEEGRKRQLRLLPDSHLNSHLILTLILVELRLDLCFSFSYLEVGRMASIYRRGGLGEL